MEHLILILLVAFVAAEFLFELTLDLLNDRWRERPVPPEVADLYEAEVRARSTRYQRSLLRLDLAVRGVSTLILLALLATGAFGRLDALLAESLPAELPRALAFFGLIYGVSWIAGLPVSVYKTFGIEARYGFNRTSPGTYAMDRLKGLLLAVVLGGALLSLLYGFYSWAGKWFWLWAWIVFGAITWLFTAFYTAWLLPLFNKLEPLPEGGLREAIEAYARKVSFPLTEILVMDGSRRSSKGNAFFSGLGPRKRIVLYDTLIEKHDTDELVSVLAHEVGHYKKRHVRQGFVLSQVQMLLIFLLLGWALNRPELSGALGGEGGVFHLGLLAFAILYGPVSTLSGLAFNALSRRNEFQADAWARETSDATALVRALKRLSADHLGNPNPHPAYVFFHYTHPPLALRIRALEQDV